MRRFALVVGLAVAAVGTVSVPNATAAPLTIEDFVLDCGDGVVNVVGTQRYIGGAAVLAGTCIVVPEPGATLVLRGVTLSGPGDLIATTGTTSGADVTLKVVDSDITLGGFVEFAAGAAAGDPGVPEQNGTVIIRNSTVSGAGVLATASFDWPGGRVVIRDSVVTATAGNLTVAASELVGTDGVVRVANSTLQASGDLTIRTGTDAPSGNNGLTRIVKSTLDAGNATLVDSGPNGRTIVRATAIPGSPVTITTGAGGFCRTVGLIPPIACS